jgi:dihydroflavonol-4-reductase
MAAMSRVLLTGATGLVGTAIARTLSERGFAVRAYARATSDVSRLPPGAEVMRGELDDPAALARALAGCEAVVHAAGVPTLGTHSDAELARANVASVERVLAVAREAGVRRAVVTSSTAVLGGSRTPTVSDESAPGNAAALGIGYFLSKLRGERAALAANGGGLEVVVVRPSYVLGPGDVHGSSASTVIALARRRIPGWVEGGASFCDVRDVAHGHVEALLRGRAGEVYHLGGENLPMRAFITGTCALAGVKPPPRVPFALAWANAAVQEALAAAAGRRARMTRDLVRGASLYTYVSSEKAARELGYRIRPFDDMVRDTLADAVVRGRLAPDTPELRALAAAAPAAPRPAGQAG